MSLDKAIKHHKEKRKEYKKLCEQIDKSCRCHGGCDYCLDNRMYQYSKEKERTEEEIKEWNNAELS